MTVLFIGDSPSAANTHENVAFNGTDSGKRLEGWYDSLGISPTTDTLVFVNQIEQHFSYVAQQYYLAGLPIVALGTKASAALAKLDIRYCSLPHPSGRNRQLNNKERLANRLQLCKTYLNGFK